MVLQILIATVYLPQALAFLNVRMIGMLRAKKCPHLFCSVNTVYHLGPYTTLHLFYVSTPNSTLFETQTLLIVFAYDLKLSISLCASFS